MLGIAFIFFLVIFGLSIASLAIWLPYNELGRIIAGYNVLPEEEKGKYEKKKLFKVFRYTVFAFGIEFSIFSIGIGIFFRKDLEVAILVASGILLLTLILGIVVSRKKRNKNGFY